MTNEAPTNPNSPSLAASHGGIDENSQEIAPRQQQVAEPRETATLPASKDSSWDTRIPWILTGVFIFVAVCSLVVSGFSYTATVTYSGSQTRMQFLRDIYGQYADFSIKRVEYWYLTHLFVVPDQDGGYAEYDRAVQSVRDAIDKEPLSRRLEYQLREEGLVTLILTKYEQGLYQLDEAERLKDMWLTKFLKEEVVDYFRGNLMRNPRVLHYWDDVKQLFSERLRRDVTEQLAGRSLRRDKAGPFLSPSRPQVKNSFKDLNDQFRASYRTAKEHVLKKARFVILVEGDDLVLLHQGGRTVEKFTPEIYHSLKSVAHLPLGMFVTLSGHADGTLPESAIASLSRTRQIIHSIRERSKEESLSGTQLARQSKILDASDKLIVRAIEAKQIETPNLNNYVKDMLPCVMANTEEAARSQLDGLHAAVQKWRKQHGENLVDQMYVIVMGPQAPRRGNLALQYFARLLNVKGECPRLLYSESIFDESRAVDLLATRLVDDVASIAFFGNTDRLQMDLLAEAAERHIRILFPK